MKAINRRLLFSFILICLIPVVLISRLLHIQIWEHRKLYSIANSQLGKKEFNSSTRGIIYDCNKHILALSSTVDSLAANPRLIKDKVDFTNKLLSVLDLDRDDVMKKINKERSFVWLKRYLAPEKSRSIKKLNLDGVRFVEENKRWYPHGSMACHLLGTVGIDGNGLSGIEYLYDRKISNKNGYVDIILCIDVNLQSIVENELDRIMKLCKAEKAFVIIQRPSTGEILAMAARPQFNPNSYNFTPKDLRNPSIHEIFEPGSTYKIVPVAAVLSSNIMNLDNLINCERGSFKFADIEIHDHEKYNYLTFEGVIAYSSNIGMAKIGLALGKERLYQYSQKFGFGGLTGSDLPGEQKGILHHVRSRRWTKVTAPVMSYGQGVSVTGLQLINAYSAIANGGLLLEPKIIKSQVNSNGEEVLKFKSRVIRRVVSKNTARKLKKILSEVVEYGTGTKAKVDGYTVCGKTGTAQKIDPSTRRYSEHKYIASFCGFLPADKPELTILVVVDEPKELYWGSEIACPAFSRIAKKSMNYFSIYKEGALLTHRLSDID